MQSLIMAIAECRNFTFEMPRQRLLIEERQ